MILSKKTVCDKLVSKVDDIDTTKFVLKSTYDADNLEIEKTMKSVGNEIEKHGGSSHLK